MRLKTFLGAIALVLISLPMPAAADRSEFDDPTDVTSHPRDIARVVHGHAQGGRFLRHVVVFDGEPRSGSLSQRLSLYFRYRDKDGDKVFRQLQVRKGGGGLFGRFLNRDGYTVGAAQIEQPNASKVVFIFPRSRLPGLRDLGYRWHAWVFLGVGEFDEPCTGEDAGPPLCKDRAPAEGNIRHSF